MDGSAVAVVALVGEVPLLLAAVAVDCRNKRARNEVTFDSISLAEHLQRDATRIIK